jgi:DNA replication and repair protein RecF
MLTELSVKNFRCFQSARLEFHGDTTVLIGQNAQGKTSLLEAACVLLRLQSPRTSARGDFIRFGEKTCLIEGTVREQRLRFAANVTTRRLAVDESVCRNSADYLKNSGLVVWMDHADMQLVRGGPENRRRFLDFAGSQIFPDYLKALRGYERALRSRNYLLKKETKVNWAQADAYGRVMDGFARTLTAHRSDLSTWLQPEVRALQDKLSGGENARVTYSPNVNESGLQEMLLGLRHEEERTRSTAAGIHRDDLILEIRDRMADSFASEGQQRTLALSLKIGQARVIQQQRGAAPLLLIDDIFGELDKSRRRAVLNCLPADSQKIITTTHLDWAEAGDVRGHTYEVGEWGTRLQTNSAA